MVFLRRGELHFRASAFHFVDVHGLIEDRVTENLRHASLSDILPNNVQFLVADVGGNRVFFPAFRFGDRWTSNGPFDFFRRSLPLPFQVPFYKTVMTFFKRLWNVFCLGHGFLDDKEIEGTFKINLPFDRNNQR